jgi:SAM-dependent methyltransferase
MSPISTNTADTGHLNYYRAQGIAPVHYEMRTLAEHFARRDSLYRTLGLPSAAFRGSRVLEVAAGTGQNSLYVASCAPASLDLVEPNPRGVEEIRALYRQHAGRLLEPRLHAVEFQAFAPEQLYDIVLCENWLGSLPRELVLIRKLARLVAPGGTLVVTIVPYSGFFPNVLRYLLARRIVDPHASFADQTASLVRAFGPHLKNIADMTRSHEHWVQDCVLNPHYLNVSLPPDMLLDQIGDSMEILGSSPRFAPEWRWFKGLVGEARNFSGAFLRSYAENLHNFVDYRKVLPPRRADDNSRIEDQCRALHSAALAWERDRASGGPALDNLGADILAAVSGVSTLLKQISPDWGLALDEVAALWTKPRLEADDIAAMTHFASLFGRETVYVSFTKPMQ